MFIFMAVPPGYVKTHNGPALPITEAVSAKELPKFMAANPNALIVVADTETYVPHALGKRLIEGRDFFGMATEAAKQLYEYVRQKMIRAGVDAEMQSRREYAERVKKDRANG